MTEEIAPGCRASTTSYIASMLRPEVIRDLQLAAPRPAHGALRSGAARAVSRREGRRRGGRTASGRSRELEAPLGPGRAHVSRVDDELKRLARYLQPFFLEPPPDVHTRGLAGILEALRVGRRFRGISGDEIGRMVSFLTGSLGDFLDRNYESEKVKTLFLANNVYGKHGGPYQPGTAIGLLFHLLSGGEHELQGFYGHVIGGMGAITQAMAAAARGFGAEIRTGAPVARIDVRDGRARGVLLEDGTEIRAGVVVSNADPKRTFLSLVDATELAEDFRRAIAGIKMDGPCAKVNLVLSEEPRVTGMPRDFTTSQRALFTLVPSLEFAERCYDDRPRGELPEELWVDCVVASNVDASLAPPGRHVMTCFVQYVPYRLREGTWDQKRDARRPRDPQDRGVRAERARAVVARQVLTPLDLERTYGLTEGNIFHGDLSLEQLFFLRPVSGWARYRTPVDRLYLCGAGAHPGRRRDGRARTQRRPPGPQGLEAEASRERSAREDGRRRRSSARESWAPRSRSTSPAAAPGAFSCRQGRRRERRQRALLRAGAHALQLPARGPARGQEPGDLPLLEGIRRTGRRLPADRLRADRARKELDRLEKNVAMQRSHGVDARVVTRAELSEIVPDWDVTTSRWPPGNRARATAMEPASPTTSSSGPARWGWSTGRRRASRRFGSRRPHRRRRDGPGRRGGARGRGRDGPLEPPAPRAARFDLPVEGEYHEVAILKNPPGLREPAPACIDGITTTYFRSEVGGLTLVGDFYGKRGADPDDFPSPRRPTRSPASSSGRRDACPRWRRPASGGASPASTTSARTSAR